MTNKTAHLKKDLIAALENNKGIVSNACKELGISRNTYYDYYRNDPEFKDTVDELKNIVLDFAEENLYKRVESGDTTALIFLLKTIGKHRGYVEKIEHEHSGEVSHKLIEWKPAQ